MRTGGRVVVVIGGDAIVGGSVPAIVPGCVVVLVVVMDVGGAFGSKSNADV